MRKPSVVPNTEAPRLASLGYTAEPYVPKPLLSPKKSVISVGSPTKSFYLSNKQNSIASANDIVFQSPSNYGSAKPVQVVERNAIDPTSGSNVASSNANTNPPNWCLKKDCGVCHNVVWVIVCTTLVLCVIAVFTLLIVKAVLQQNANANAPTGQSGKFVGEACNSSSECSQQAICTGATCQCVSEMYYDVYYGQCLPLKLNGQACLETRECNQYYGLACSNSFCSCPVQSIWANYYGTLQCIRTREVGETCQNSDHCVTNAYCALQGSTYRCTCASGTFISGVTGQCEPTKKVNERCYGWFQECPSSTVCRTNNNGDGTQFCQCIEGTYYNSTTQTCTKLANVNEGCSSTSQCNTMVGLYCLNNVCVCPSNVYWNGTYCQYYSSYGRPCSSSQLCIQSDANLVCGIPPNGISQQMCYCKTNYYFDEYLQSCVRLKSEGSICYEVSECVDNATCTGNVCKCYPGYWSNPTTGECDIQLVYGETCSSTVGSKPCNNLIYGINCFSGTCTCDPTYEYWDGSYCQPRRHYQEACSTTDLCAVYRGLSCQSSVCQCDATLSYNSAFYWCT